MGKRQLGELEVSELVSTLLLSDIAALPITSPDIPLIYAIIPIIVITAFEITLSVLLTKTPLLKNLISARPSALIRHGKIDGREMTKNRISIDELFSELRQKDVSNISDVDYAILEQNGKITVIKKKSASPPTLTDLGISAEESGISHIIISDGRIDVFGLKQTGKKRQWLENYLKKAKISPSDVYIMTLDDKENINLIKRSDLLNK
jgi:uncharacterized membrane protein YcaP (DUF421 family)